MQYLRKELLAQGEGYSNFINYIESKLSDGLRQLISQIVTTQPKPHTTDEILPISEISEFTNLAHAKKIPVWIHNIPLRTY